MLRSIKSADGRRVSHDRPMDIDIKKHLHRLNLKSPLSSLLYKQSGGLRDQIDACSFPVVAAYLAVVLISPIFVSCHLTTQPETRSLVEIVFSRESVLRRIPL
jgi:hypothetical protein